MKNFKNTKTFKRIIIAIVIIIICSFFFGGKVNAKDSSYGGKLLNPVMDLIVFIGDGLNSIVHRVIYQQDWVTINVDMGNNIIEAILTVVAFVVVAIAAAALIVFTAGLAAGGLAALGIAVGTVSAGTVIAVATTAGIVGAAYFSSNFLPDDFKVPVFQISPEEIFSNRVNLFDVDFFNPNEDIVAKDRHGDIIYDSDGNPVEIESTAKVLRSVVSNWYNILRDISIVALLSILVYTGIRILMSSASNDKAKYKQMLLDWIVAICLLFVMQYIMSFSNMLVEKIIDVISPMQSPADHIAIIADENGKIEKTLQEYSLWDDSMAHSENGEDVVMWPTNLMGMMRIQAQYAKKQDASYAGYAIMYVVLVFFTIYFIFTYLKRVLYMAFLTVISPLVALTYPIDKMNDGKAQAFNSWLKEYIFNLLIQPMHLILYTVLVTSAASLAAKNPIYSLVALGFMVPAEKLMRKFFGFEKAHTPGLLAGPAGAAATMGIMNKILGKAPNGGSDKASGKGALGTGDSKPKVRYTDNVDTNSLLYNRNGNNGETGELPTGNNNLLEDPNIIALNGENQPQDTGGTLPSFAQNSNIGADGANTPNGTVLNSGDNIRFNNNDTGANRNDRLPDTANNGELPFEDKLYNFGGGLGSLAGQTVYGGIHWAKDRKAAFDESKIGQGVGKVKDKVANSRPIRGIKNSRTFNGGMAAAKFYAHGMKENMKEKAKNAHLGRKAIRTAAGLGVGAVAGGLALGAGIAGGDLNKAVQYTAAAGLAGYKAGGGTVKAGMNALSIDGTANAFNNAFYGEEKMREKAIQERTKEVQKDKSRQEELEIRLESKQKAEEAMKVAAPECTRYGLDKANEIAAVYSRMQQGASIQQAIGEVAEAKTFKKDTNTMGHKDRDDFEKTINDRVTKNNSKASEEENKAHAKRLIDNIDAVSKILYKDI